MGRVITGLLLLSLVVAGCSDGDRLTDSEAMWCRVTQPGFRLLEAGEEHGIDLTGVIEEAERMGDTPGTLEERQDAFEEVYDLLEGDAGYIEVCQALYDDAGRPFDLEGDLP